MEEGRQAKLIAAALFVSLFLLWGSCYNTFGVFFTPLLKEFNGTHASISLLATAIVSTTGIAALLTGWLIKSTDVRVVMGVGAILAGVSLIGISRSNTLNQLLIWYMVLGIGLGSSTMVPASVVITNWFKERRATVLGVSTVGMELGGMLMTLLASYLITTRGWRTAYFVLAIPIFIIVVPVIFLVVRTRPHAIVSEDRVAPILAENGLEVREAFRKGSFWLLATTQLSFGLGAGGAFVHLVPLMLKMGYSEATGAIVLSIVLGLIVPGKPTMGVLGDRFGARKTLSAGLAVAALGALCMADAHQVIILAIGILLFGLTLASPVPLVPVILADIIGIKSMGPLFGTLILIQFIGLGISPVIMGKIFDVTGTYAIGYCLTAAILFAGSLSVLGCTVTYSAAPSRVAAASH
jgi:MFS family permease